MPVSRCSRIRIYRLLLRGLDHRPGADRFAALLGCTDRHHLRRETRRLCLPPPVTLLSLARVIGLIRGARRDHRSLCDHAVRQGLDPAWLYRAVRQLTGQPWHRLRQASPRTLVRLALVHRRPLPAAPRRSVAARLQAARRLGSRGVISDIPS